MIVVVFQAGGQLELELAKTAARNGPGNTRSVFHSTKPWRPKSFFACPTAQPTTVQVLNLRSFRLHALQLLRCFQEATPFLLSSVQANTARD